MKTQHTPGPWRTGTAEAGTLGIVYSPKGTVTDCVTCLGDADPEALANARLIAAAPDLLAALQLALATIQRLAPPNPFDHTQGTRDVISAAIDKAQGT